MKDFKFGLEAEYCLATLDTLKPIWYKDISFKQIDDCFTKISLEGIPSLEGLSAEPPHKKLMPFIVEGYGIPNENFEVIDALPKGIEIRTPVCQSIDQAINVFELLYSRVKENLKTLNVMPIALSHHPLEDKFSGPQNKRRHDFWLWAMEVMTTYGPDINVSFPKEITEKLFANIEDLEAKVNYYAPAIALATLNSPFYLGKPWIHKGNHGKSYRTFKRSIIAPAIELHPDENFRIEFKVCEMTNSSQDFYAYFLLVLNLFLNEDLKGRATKQERIYDLGQISYLGFKEQETSSRLKEILNSCEKTLKNYDLNLNTLSIIQQRMKSGLTPADELIKYYEDHNQSLSKVIDRLSYLHTLEGNLI